MKKEEIKDIKEEVKRSFFELLLEAIQNKDLNFIENNIDKINFINYGVQNELWSQISILQSLIVNNFVSGFEIIFDKYIKTKNFDIFVDGEFNFIIKTACHYSKPDILKIICDKSGLDLTSYDEEGRGIIHLVFESVNNSSGNLVGGAYVEDEEVIKMIAFLKKNNVNVLEPYPCLHEDAFPDDYTVQRKEFHSIYTFLIVKGKFEIFSTIIKEEDRLGIIKKNKKTHQTIKFLYRYILTTGKPLDKLDELSVSEEKEFIFTDDEKNTFVNQWLTKIADFSKKFAVELLIQLLEDDVENIYNIIKEQDFLFNISDLVILNKLSENSKSFLTEKFKDEKRKNNKMFIAPAWLIKENFNNINFFNLIKDLKEIDFNIYDIINKSEKCLDAIVNAFQSQKKPPYKLLLKAQISFINNLDQKIFDEKLEYKNNYSYLDFIKMTIAEWEDKGFFVEEKV